MYDEVLMRVLHGVAHCAKETQPLFSREALLVAITIDRSSFDVLHYEVRNPVSGFAAVEESSNVRMIEIGEDLHLVTKAFANAFAAETWIDQFDGNLPAVLFVIAFGKKDCTHSAVAELAQNLVRADTTSNPRRSFTVSIDSKARGVGGAFLHRVVAGVDLMSQQQIDFGAQVCIVCARRIEKLSLSIGVQFQCFSEDALHLLPAIRSNFGFTSRC